MPVLNIAALGRKPTPLTKHRDGIEVGVFCNGRVNSLDCETLGKGVDAAPGKGDDEGLGKGDGKGLGKGDDEDLGKKGSRVFILDVRTAHTIDRESIMRELAKRGIDRVGNKKLPQQSAILEESEIDSVLPPSPEKIQSITQEIQFELPSDDLEIEPLQIEAIKKGKKVVIKKGRKPPSKKGVKEVSGQEESDPKDSDQEVSGQKESDPKESDQDGSDQEETLVFEKRVPSAVVEHRLQTSSFYMNNRKKFLSQLMPMFSNYKRELSNSDKVASCDDTSSAKGESRDFKLMTHQKVVSDYLNLYTPYRGLLLYHGLGSGKTCTSIAIAEGMKSQKKIYVFTLAALKANFFDQMKVCGDPIYKLDQFWEFISTDGQPNYVKILSKTLNLPEEYVRKRKGAWMVNVKQKSNFNDLADSDKKSLNEQLDEMIRSKYVDLNYNGLTKKIMSDITDNYKKNPFDNCVVIVDEVHNFVSRIVNKMREKTSISYRLYEYLMSATNARIVLLSGTPIINYPNEIGILFNILRGYIKTWTFPFQIMEGASSPSRDSVMEWFKQEGLNRYDYVEFSGQQLTITRNPFGFVNKFKSRTTLKRGGGSKKKRRIVSKGQSKKKRIADSNKIFTHANGLVQINDPIPGSKIDETDENRIERIAAGVNVQRGGGAFNDYEGVELDETGNMNDTDFKQVVIRILGKYGLRVENAAKVKLVNNKSLPDVSKEFLEMFVELGAKDMKNERVFQRRILGLTSYFKGASDGLYPRFVPSDHDNIYHIERVQMSAYQFGIYEKIRADESKREKQNKKRQAKQDKGKEAENLFKIPSTYRIASRMCCNFAFPDPPGRPQKRDGEKGGDDEMGEEDFDEEKIVSGRGQKKIAGGQKKKKAKGDTEQEEEEVLDKEEEEEEVLDKEEEVLDKEEEEEEEDKEEEVLDKEEEVLDKEEEEVLDKEEEEVLDKEEEEVLDKEEEVLDKEEEEEEGSKLVLEGAPDIELEGVESLDSQDSVSEETAKPDESLDYPKRMLRALNELKGRAEEIFSKSGLQMYSPKFLKILENIQDKKNIGLHLLYSQFRSMEGIGIFKLVLEANGFAQLKIRKVSGDWEIEEDESDKGKPKFALHTGTESDEEKKIILNIYNSKWKEVPSGIVSAFQTQGHENNHMGEVVRVLMITASGAEGINLKNTRFVHIIEPYWHMVRLEQVIGRARRICSHQDLPPDLRTVKVFLYMSVLSQEQQTPGKHIDLKNRDVSKLTSKSAAESANSTLLERYVRHLKTTPIAITTDQQLFENALVKDHVNSQILHAVKETAMDCRLYEKQNKSENLVCFNFGTVSTNAFATYPTIAQDLASKDVDETQETNVKLVTITYKGVKYAMNENNGDLFDIEEAKEKLKDADANMNELTVIGKKTGAGSRMQIELFDV